MMVLITTERLKALEAVVKRSRYLSGILGSTMENRRLLRDALNKLKETE